MRYNLTDDEIQEVINSVSGKGKRDISWEQFNTFVAKKI
jgi:Ca2+-binding EF-hand superfamily protein